MKKLMTTLLAVLMVFGCAATSVAADEPDTDTVDVIYSIEPGYEWAIPTGDQDLTNGPVDGNVSVSKAFLAKDHVLIITIDGGMNQMEEATGYGSAAGFNMVSADDSNYFVSYKIEQAATGSDAGDTNVAATLKSGQIKEDDELIVVPAGQAVKQDDTCDLFTEVVEALTFTRTGNAALVGNYSDTLTFTAEVKEAQ